MVATTLTTAFVLRTHPYGESDRIVTFITEDCGKVSGIAKGAKRSQRRFAGTLEPFVKVRLAFRSRPRSELAFIERCELLEALPNFRVDLDRFACGSYILELTDRMVMGREPGREVFLYVEAVLSMLDRLGAHASIIRAFELHILEAAGYRPELDRCRSCGCHTAALPLVVIVPARGGAFCPRCRPATEAGHPLPGSTCARLADLQRLPITAATVPLTDDDVTKTGDVLEGLIGHVVIRPLRSRTVLSALRQPARACQMPP